MLLLWARKYCGVIRVRVSSCSAVQRLPLHLAGSCAATVAAQLQGLAGGGVRRCLQLLACLASLIMPAGAVIARSASGVIVYYTVHVLYMRW